MTELLKTGDGLDLTKPEILQSLLPWAAPDECKVKQLDNPSSENHLGAGIVAILLRLTVTNIKPQKMVEAILSAICMDEIWAENIISPPI